MNIKDLTELFKVISKANKNPQDFLLIVACIVSLYFAIVSMMPLPFFIILAYIIFDHFCMRYALDEFVGIFLMSFACKNQLKSLSEASNPKVIEIQQKINAKFIQLQDNVKKEIAEAERSSNDL